MCTLYTFEWHLQEWSFHIQRLQAHTGKGCTKAHTQLQRCLNSRSQYQLLYDHTCIAFSLLASTLLYSTTNCTQKARRSLFREHTYSQKEFICWNNLSLFCCHLQEIFFVNFEEPPPLLSGQIRGTPSLIEPDGWFVPLRNKEVHAAAAALHSNLQKRATWHVSNNSPRW